MKTGYPGQERMFRFVVTNSPILSSNLKTMTMKRNALILIMTAAVILTGQYRCIQEELGTSSAWIHEIFPHVPYRE